MISTVKKEITIQNELLSKIKWACTFSNCEPKIKDGNLRKLEKFNVAYVEPHKAIIKDNFNGCVLKTHSASEIAEKIEYLRDNMEIRKKFGLRSAEIVKERFSKEIVIDKTLCVYNKILSTTKR